MKKIFLISILFLSTAFATDFNQMVEEAGDGYGKLKAKDLDRKVILLAHWFPF